MALLRLLHRNNHALGRASRMRTHRETTTRVLRPPTPPTELCCGYLAMATLTRSERNSPAFQRLFRGESARRMDMPEWLTPLKETATRWSEHKDARLGAALAYYSIFSVGPLIVIAVAIAGFVFGAEAV